MKQLAGVFLVIMAAFGASPALAAPANGPGTPTTEEAKDAVDQLGRETPYGAAMGYLAAAAAGDWSRAAEYLDLDRVPRARRDREGIALAKQLKLVLDHGGWIDRRILSREPEGDPTDSLGADRDRIGLVRLRGQTVDLVLARTVKADSGPIWQFSDETVAQIPAMAKELGSSPLEALMPDTLVGLHFLDVAAWQWIGLGLLVPTALLMSWLLLRTALAVTHLIPRTRTGAWQRALEGAIPPLRLFVAVLTFGVGTFFLGISIFVRQYIGRTVELIALLALVWLVVRLIDVFSAVATGHLVDRQRVSALSAITLGRRAVKVLVVTLAVFSALATLGFNITPVLAALGVGGIAVALAAQKTIENLFGGVTLIADQPIRVGDFCRFGDRVGTIEDIGLRSTRIRTLDRTVVSVPNGAFSALELENFSRRDRIWLKATLGLRYETTPDQLRYVLVEIRKMLYAHPKVYLDPARIRFVGFGAYALELEIFAYVRTADYGEFLAIREDIYLRIIEIVAASGTGFAFPSQTMYVRRDPGLDEAKGHAAEEQVRSWRAQRELWLPEFPADRVDALADTLEYPPDGARR